MRQGLQSVRNQKWPEEKAPLVTVFCAAYNHEAFIKEALEGFLIQETNFPVEIFVHDDASEDRTQEILKEYQGRHPNLFRLVLQSKNQLSKGFSKIFIDHMFHMRGSYIALCDGDDYWIEPKKLQRQVDHFQSNPELSLVCTQYLEKQGDQIQPPSFSFRAKVTRRNWASPYSLKTATAMFRLRDLLEVFPSRPFLHCKDIVLWRLLLQMGDAHVLPEPTAVYRIHRGGISSLQTEFGKSLSNLKSAKTMLCLLGNQEPDLREFYKGAFKDCLKHLDQGSPEDLVLLLRMAVKNGSKYLPIIFWAWLMCRYRFWKRASLGRYWRQHVSLSPRQSFSHVWENYHAWAKALRDPRPPLETESPWINLNCVEFIRKRAGQLPRIAEFGSGGSTLFFLRCAQLVVTVEHDPYWFQSVSSAVRGRGWQEKWQGLLESPEPCKSVNEFDPADPERYFSADRMDYTFRAYASALDRFADFFFDLILVDGRARPSCVKHAVPKIRTGGFLVLDNTERAYYLGPMTRVHLQGFVPVFDEFGPVPGLAHFNRATIFQKKALAAVDIRP